MTWVDGLVPHLKALHIGLVALWMGGLFALPRMLATHDLAHPAASSADVRRATHYGFVWVVTPVAVLAIGSGTALIFMREVFTGWILAKVALVAVLVAIHSRVGHTILAVAESEGRHQPPDPLVPTLLVCAAVTGVLTLVLAKPELDEIAWPASMLAPLGRQLPFDVPIR